MAASATGAACNIDDFGSTERRYLTNWRRGCTGAVQDSPA
jgi:hypothetical protein